MNRAGVTQLRSANARLLHVGADTTNLGIVGPLFTEAEDRFEFIPASDAEDAGWGRCETRTYRDLPVRNGKIGETLADFLPPDLEGLHPHVDPDFDGFTYGEPDESKLRINALRKLCLGDVLFFIAGLAPYDQDIYLNNRADIYDYQVGKKNKYVIGFFTISGFARIRYIRTSLELSTSLLSAYEAYKRDQVVRVSTEHIQELLNLGYVKPQGEGYTLTNGRDTEFHGLEMAEVLESGCEAYGYEVLREGLFKIVTQQGEISEHEVRANHHFTRLCPLDWDEVIVWVGNRSGSALLSHAVRLTEKFDRYEFVLNRVGRQILRKERDNLRGVRKDIKGDILAAEIMRQNPELSFDLRDQFDC